MILVRWWPVTTWTKPFYTLWHFSRDGHRTLCGRGDAPRRSVQMTTVPAGRICLRCADSERTAHAAPVTPEREGGVSSSVSAAAWKDTL